MRCKGNHPNVVNSSPCRKSESTIVHGSQSNRFYLIKGLWGLVSSQGNKLLTSPDRDNSETKHAPPLPQASTFLTWQIEARERVWICPNNYIRNLINYSFLCKVLPSMMSICQWCHHFYTGATQRNFKLSDFKTLLYWKDIYIAQMTFVGLKRMRKSVGHVSDLMEERERIGFTEQV